MVHEVFGVSTGVRMTGVSPGKHCKALWASIEAIGPFLHAKRDTALCNTLV